MEGICQEKRKRRLPSLRVAFGGDSDALSSLVIEGKKTATASAYPLYGRENEKLPEKGDYSVILDGKGNGVCIIRTENVSVVPFSDVGEDHAYKEGEGDRSLEYWRRVHKEFFTECMEEAGEVFSPDMDVVLEEFSVVYRG